MKLAETVTFGGSALERAAELRGDAEAMEALRADPQSAAIVYWRGKPLIRRGERDALARLPLGTPALEEGLDRALFLGREEAGNAVFAVDISGWQPEEVDEEALRLFLDPTEQSHPDLPKTDVFAELRANMTRLTPRDAELAATARALFSWHDSHRFCAKCGAPSEMSMAGWQRSCAACGGQHFPRTDPVVIMLILHKDKALVGRQAVWPATMWSLLAGFMEPGETIETAVRRETLEEAGVPVGRVKYVACQPWPFPSSLMVACVAEALTDALKIDTDEIEAAIWVDRDEMQDAVNGRHPRIGAARKGAIARDVLDAWSEGRIPDFD